MFKVNWEFEVNGKVQQLREKNPSLNAVFFFFFYTSASFISGVIKLLMYLYGIDRICTADAV